MAPQLPALPNDRGVLRRPLPLNRANRFAMNLDSADQALNLDPIATIPGAEFSHADGKTGECSDRGPPYNVASLGFEWSLFIDRQGGQRSLIVSEIDRRASRFVAGESESPQVLMRHRRPASGPTADGVAHGPVQGSPSAASARIVRSDKIEPPAPDRRLRSSHADRSAHSPAVEPRRCPDFPIEDSESGR